MPPHTMASTMILEGVGSKGAYAIVVSDALEIVLFGIYTIFFTFALIILTVYKRPLPVDWFMVAALCVLYGTCMTHCSLVTTDRYSTLGSSDWPIPTGYEMSGLLRGADGLLKVASFISQLLMIHRCWAVWDHAWSVVCAPVLMAIASFVCAVIGPARLPLSEFRSPFIAPRLLLFDVLFCVFALLVDTLVTTLIIYRLRHLSADARRAFQSVSDAVFALMACVVETGALLAVAQLAMLVFLVLEHPAVIIVESIAAQIYGIAPTLMIIRLGLRLLPEGRVRWASTVPEFSTLVVGTTISCGSDIELAQPHTHTHVQGPGADARPAPYQGCSVGGAHHLKAS
ncbi:hypothetical protein C8Q79DRAFT_668183 [Trametes meyenii]|nr:hypothetical protein C8Q79DRAFT_668183 [Trametes meyenii]